MTKSLGLLDQIKEMSAGFSPTAQQVAEVILEDPHEVINMSIAALSARAGVSEPTVVRFCRSLGMDGFREFKLRLAQELAVGASYMHPKVQPGDETSALIEKVGRAAVQTLSGVVAQLHPGEVEAVIDRLAAANRVEFYGFGASGVVAIDAYHKFFRLGIPCVALYDSHMQCMSASTLGPGDVVVAISHTGRSKELIENVRVAKAAGAFVIGITTPQSPLADECSQVLGVLVQEDTDVFPPMHSRLAHLVLLDILVTGVALRKGKEVTDRLRRMREALVVKRPKGRGGVRDETV